MEILSFLRLTPKRLAGLAAVGGLAAGGGVVLALGQPATYAATTTVFVGQALPANANVFDLAPLVADFQADLALVSVRQAAADAAGVPLSGVVIASARNGDGSTVNVTASAAQPAAAEALARTVAVQAMKTVADRQVERATQLESQRRAEVSDARQTLSDLDRQNGFSDPTKEYDAVLNEVTRLSLAAEDPAQQLTDLQRTQIQAQVKKLRDSLPQLSVKADSYQTARKDLERAEDNLSTAIRDRVAAEAVAAGAVADTVISPHPAVATSALPALVRAGGGALVVSTATGMGLLALLDGRKRRRPSRAVPVTVAAADGGPLPPAEDLDVAPADGSGPAGAGAVTDTDERPVGPDPDDGDATTADHHVKWSAARRRREAARNGQRADLPEAPTGGILVAERDAVAPVDGQAEAPVASETLPDSGALTTEVEA